MWARTSVVRLVAGALLAFGLPVIGAAMTWGAVADRVSMLVWQGLALLVGGALFTPVAWMELGPFRRVAATLRGYLGRRSAEVGAATGDISEALDRLLEELSGRNALLEETATIDNLTGLPNRMAALDRLRQGLQLVTRDHIPLTVAFVDIDGLDAINERHSYRLGDRVLASVAHRLEGMVRGTDWAARWDGDAFLVVLHADPDGSMVALDRIVRDLAGAKLVIGEEKIPFTVSVGATRVRVQESVRPCVDRALQQLAEAKRQGAGSFSLEE